MKKQKLLAILFAVILALSSFAMAGCGEDKKAEESEDKKHPPISNSELESEKYYYDDIVTQFETKGFTNIETRPVYELQHSHDSDINTTKEISINGTKDFSSEDLFSIDSKVVITYYIGKERTEPKGTENSTSSTTTSSESTTIAETTAANKSTTVTTSANQTSERYSSKAKFSSIYINNLNKYKSLVNTFKQKINTVYNSLGNTYNSYVSNADKLNEWYTDLEKEYTALFKETETITDTYLNKVKTEMSGSDYDTWDDETSYFYDDYYDGAMNDLYDEIYDGLLDEIYDKYYDGILDEEPENIEYSDYSKTRSTFYKKWSNARSTFYKAWSKARSTLYKAWSKTRSDLYKNS